MVETQNAIKLLRELKTNKFLPKYNVKIEIYINDWFRIKDFMMLSMRLNKNT